MVVDSPHHEPVDALEVSHGADANWTGTDAVQCPQVLEHVALQCQHPDHRGRIGRVEHLARAGEALSGDPCSGAPAAVASMVGERHVSSAPFGRRVGVAEPRRPGRDGAFRHQPRSA